MNILQIETLVGLFLVGMAIDITRNSSEAGSRFAVHANWFQLLFGLILLALAMWQGMRLVG